MRFAGFFITLGSVAFWISVTEYWDDFKKMLNEIDPNIIPLGLLSLIIIAGVVFVYDYRTRKSDESKEDKEIYKKIYKELEDGIKSLDGTYDRQTPKYEINGKKIEYKHIYMNHKVFDSLINSGEFNQISDELQQPIQDIYGKIEIHDDIVNKIVNLPEESTQKEEEYVLNLYGYEEELKKEIPSMMENLRKYL